jgi:gamma-glutamyl-gamma-aminobutyraldehyde dehydrogenase
VKSYIEQAKAEQRNIVCGGNIEQDMFVEPTIVDGISASDTLFKEEVFGPILSVTTFNTLDEAIALANDSVYGLAALCIPVIYVMRSNSHVLFVQVL